MSATDQQILRTLLNLAAARRASADTGPRDAEPAAAIEDLPVERVLKVARWHRLSALLGATEAVRAPASLAAAFRRDHLATVGRNVYLRHALRECVTALAARSIDCIVMKGLVYEQELYGVVGARPTTDLDLLVRVRDRRAAFDALTSLGFGPEAAAPGFDEPNYHEVEFKRRDIYVDLHTGLAPFVRCAIDYDAVWGDVRRVDLEGLEVGALAPSHAAVYHALHAAIHHFDIPAIHLLDLARIVTSPEEARAARDLARAWRCHRPWTTMIALTAAWLPAWAAKVHADQTTPTLLGARIAQSYGVTVRLPRPAQLRRKYQHFDSLTDALRYTFVQGRRALRERWQRDVLKRSPAQRLGLGDSPTPRAP